MVQGRQMLNILGDEGGDVVARVNEEPITKDDPTTGGPIDSRYLMHAIM